MGHMMLNGFWGHGGAMGLGWIFWLLLMAGVIWLVSRLLLPAGKEAGTALTILRERYARGEITSEELKKMERNLRS